MTNTFPDLDTAKRLRNGHRFFELARRESSRDVFQLREIGFSGQFECYLHETRMQDVVCFIFENSIHRIKIGHQFSESVDLPFNEIGFVEEN
jgi:hypothetical protein